MNRYDFMLPLKLKSSHASMRSIHEYNKVYNTYRREKPLKTKKEKYLSSISDRTDCTRQSTIRPINSTGHPSAGFRLHNYIETSFNDVIDEIVKIGRFIRYVVILTDARFLLRVTLEVHCAHNSITTNNAFRSRSRILSSLMSWYTPTPRSIRVFQSTAFSRRMVSLKHKSVD